MRSRLLLAAQLVAGTSAVVVYAFVGGSRAEAQRKGCPPASPAVVDITASNDPAVRRDQWRKLQANLKVPGMTVRLWPDVDLKIDREFPDNDPENRPDTTLPANFLPIRLGPCVNPDQRQRGYGRPTAIHGPPPRTRRPPAG
jgi:hypothetical protein